MAEVIPIDKYMESPEKYIQETQKLLRRVLNQNTDYSFSQEEIDKAYHQAAAYGAFALLYSFFKEGYISSHGPIYFSIRCADGRSMDIKSAADAYQYSHGLEKLGDFTITIHDDVVTEDVTSVMNFIKQFRSNLEIKFGCHFTDQQWHLFLDKAANAQNNEALSIAFKKHWERQIGEKGETLVSLLFSAPGRSFQLMNQLSSFKAHNDMPLSKIKYPLSPQEVVQYCSEFGKNVPLQLVSLKRSAAQFDVSEQQPGIDSFLSASFPKIYRTWRDELVDSGKEPNAYVPVFIHPLTIPFLKDHFSKQIADQTLYIPEKCIELPAIASLSFRSLIASSHHDIMIKTAVPVEATGSIRKLSQHVLHKGAKASDIICHLLHQKGCYGDTFFSSPDWLSISLNPKAVPEVDDWHAGFLGCIIRQSPAAYAKEGEITMPLAGLFYVSPHTHKSVISELIDHSKQSPENYFRHYIRTLLKPQMNLLLEFGIALQTHQQNMNVAFRPDGFLSWSAMHSASSATRAYLPILEQSAVNPDDLNILKGLEGLDCSIHKVVSQFVYNNFVGHLIPLATEISKDFLLGPDELYAILIEETRAVVSKTIDELKQRDMMTDDRRKVARQLENAVLNGKQIPTKAYFGKLLTQTLSDTQSNAQNVISGFGVFDNPLVLQDRATKICDATGSHVMCLMERAGLKI